MAYNRKNHLHKVIEVQQIVKDKKKFGATQEFIYKKYIMDQYHISRNTFYKYLSTPAYMELRKLNAK